MRPQLQLTNEGKVALIGVTAVSITHFLCGSSFDINNEEIQDENPFQFSIAFQKTYIKGQQYQKDGETVTEGYNHIKVLGYLSASDITFDETGEFTVREIALMGTVNNEDVVIAYGYDEEGIKLYEDSEERQVIKLDIICEDTPNININNSTGYVNYGDFLDHKNGILTSNNPVHGLTYQNNRLYINGSPLTIDVEGVSNAVFDNVIGVNSEIEVLPSASDYTLGHIIRDKATGLMYKCVDNGGTNTWQTLQPVNPRFETIESRLSAIQWFPTREDDTAYTVGDVVKHSSCTPFQYLECVVAGTSDSSNPTLASTGQLMTDGTVKWLVLDLRDSAPVGTYKTDVVQRKGWLKANGAEVNRTDYPRLWAWVQANSLSVTATNIASNPGKFGEGDGSTTFTLPNFEDYFVRYSFTRVSGHKQDSQMASHTHTCQDHTGSHDHTAGNQSASHNHKYIYDSMVGATGTNGSIVSGTGYGRTIGKETTTYNQDTNHTHTINSKSITHRHTINSTGSGSNTYPDNIAMQMYIKY